MRLSRDCLIVLAVLLAGVLLIAATGCGSSGTSPEPAAEEPAVDCDDPAIVALEEAFDEYSALLVDGDDAAAIEVAESTLGDPDAPDIADVWACRREGR